MSSTLPMAATLQRAADAGTRSFIATMQGRDAAAQAGQVRTLTDTLAALQKNEAARLGDVQKGLDAVQKLLTLQQQATAELAADWKTTGADLQARLDEERTARGAALADAELRRLALLTALEAVADAVARLAASVAGWTARPNGSAGGVVNGPARPDELLPAGYPWATGDIRLSGQWAMVRGWLPCDGRELPRARYPELAAVIGDAFGVAGQGETYFRLPAKAQLTADAVVLDNAQLNFWIRT